MAEKPATPEPKRRWFQFSMRTLLIGVAALSVLLAQRPLIDRTPLESFFVEIPHEHDSYTMIVSGGTYYVPARVMVVASIEAAALIGWIAWRWLRRPATKS